MNIKINFLLFIAFMITSNLDINAQDNAAVNVVLSKKTQYNKEHTFGDGFKIQLYNGRESRAYEVKNDYEFEFKKVAELSYESPEWKVRVGHFLTRLEADRALLSIKEKFRSAIVLETRIRR